MNWQPFFKTLMDNGIQRVDLSFANGREEKVFLVAVTSQYLVGTVSVDTAQVTVIPYDNICAARPAAGIEDREKLVHLVVRAGETE